NGRIVFDSQNRGRLSHKKAEDRVPIAVHFILPHCQFDGTYRSYLYFSSFVSPGLSLSDQRIVPSRSNSFSFVGSAVSLPSSLADTGRPGTRLSITISASRFSKFFNFNNPSNVTRSKK